MKIFKYKLYQEIEMPQGAQVISAQTQGTSIQIWAIVDELNPIEKRKFRALMTGEAFDPTYLKFIDTVQLSGLVVHIFENLQAF